VFCDRGPQYRPLIFVRDSTHRKIAEASKATVAKLFEKPIAVQIVPATPFYAAEEYHQEYYKKNPERYEAYRRGCGRDRALAAAWAQAKVQ
jgi:peptide-methionine (S)-S-oxide reductase